MRRQRSDMVGWKPKPKFTAGLNVSQKEWDRIFGKKKKKSALDKSKMFDEMLESRFPKLSAQSLRHHYQSEDGFPCSCGRSIDDPIHIPRISA